MGRTRINVVAVSGLSSQAQRAKDIVADVRWRSNSVRGQMEQRILNRNNIAGRFRNINSQLLAIENSISKIKVTVERGASNYRNTDLRVQIWRRALDGKIAKVGRYHEGASRGISMWTKQARDKVQVSDKDEKESLFKQILKDDWKLEGSVISGKKVVEGEILGVHSSGSVEGDLIGGTIETKSQASWDTQEGNVVIEKSIEAEGHLAKGEVQGDFGVLHGEVAGSVGNVGATGSVGASLFKDGKLSPALEAKVGVEASVAKGDAEVSIGNDEFDAHGKASGTVLGAEAEAKAGVGVITYKDENTGATKRTLGVEAEVGAEAYLAEGEVSGGITILGIEIDVGIEGKAGGVGVSAGGRVTTDGISGKIGAGLGLGLGLEISIDWSGFSLW